MVCPNSSSTPKGSQWKGDTRKPTESILWDLHRVVIGFPAFQFLKAEKTLGQVRLVLGRAVDEASLRHLKMTARERDQQSDSLNELSHHSQRSFRAES